MSKNLMIVAGEVSGDLHGASLIRELKSLDGNLKISGIGGDRMQAAGMKLVYHIRRMAFLGFVEVLRHLPFIKKVQKDLIEHIKEEKISHVVLIDYPGFNLNFAKKLKKLGVKIIYYISPQIWAWGAGRINKIKRLVDQMLVVFPFEKKLYEGAGVKVEFVGHPLLEQIKNQSFLSKEEVISKFGLERDKEFLLLLPGSRNHEVKKIFPECIKGARKIAREFNLQIIVGCSTNIDEEIFYSLTDKNDFKIVTGCTYDLMRHSKIGIIKSGTSTLEAGMFELPMVIVYKTNPLTYLIGRSLVKVNNIGMANIILEDNVVPELIQNEVTSEKIYSECKKILKDTGRYNFIKKKLGKIKEKLGADGASVNAANIIHSLMYEI